MHPSADVNRRSAVVDRRSMLDEPTSSGCRARRSRSQRHDRQRAASDRAATVVEYAFALALCVMLLLAGLEVVESRASERFDDDMSEVAAEPGLSVAPGSTTSLLPTTSSNSTSSSSTSSSSTSSTTSSTIGPTTTTAAPTTTTAPPYSGALSKSCGNGNNGNRCTFTLSPAPPSGAQLVWTINPNTNYSDTPPTVRFTTTGNRTVSVAVDGSAPVSTTVSCVSANPVVKCS